MRAEKQHFFGFGHCKTWADNQIDFLTVTCIMKWMKPDKESLIIELQFCSIQANHDYFDNTETDNISRYI